LQCLFGQCLFGRCYFLVGGQSIVAFVSDARGLARQIAQIKEATTSNDAARDQLDFLETWRVEHERTLDTDAKARLADSDGAASTGTVTLNNYAAEDLYPELVAFDDLVMHGDRVTDAKNWQISADLAGFELFDFGVCGGHLRGACFAEKGCG
jgi:hypothetical protein